MVAENEEYSSDRVTVTPTRFGKLQKILNKLLASNIIPYIIILFLTANVEILGGKFMVYIMLGLAGIYNIPLFMPLVCTFISFALTKEVSSSYVSYIIIYMVYVVSKVILYKNEDSKYLGAKRITIAYFLVNSVICVINGFNKLAIVDLVTNSLLLFAIYFVFVNGFVIISSFRSKYIFSKEEMISTSVVVAICLTIFSKLQIFNFNIASVALLIVIISIAWKNDWIIGLTTGIITSLVYMLIVPNVSTLLICLCGFSGLITGILSNFNKLYLIIVFIIGNVLLSSTYVNDVALFWQLAEILVASCVIFVLPKKALVKIKNAFDSNKALEGGYENRLGPAIEFNKKIGAVGEVFESLSQITLASTSETLDETNNVIKNYLKEQIKTESISCSNKDICITDELIEEFSENISNKLENNILLLPEDLKDFCNNPENVLDDIIEIYNNMKLMRIIKLKENASNTKLAQEYSLMSKLLKNLTIDKDNTNVKILEKQKRLNNGLKSLGYTIYEDYYVENDRDVSYEFITDILTDIEKSKPQIQNMVSQIIGTKMTIKLVLNSSKTERTKIKLLPSNKYMVNAVVKQIKKTGSSINGDSYIVTEFKDNNKVIAISDGMGSGQISKDASLAVIKMIENLSKTGISNNEMIYIINRILKNREELGFVATLDMCLINEKKDVLEFTKLGADVSYIIVDNKVEKIDTLNNDSLGVAENIVNAKCECKLQKNMYVILASDGATLSTGNLQTIVDKLVSSNSLSETEIMEQVMNNILKLKADNFEDDITIIVSKIY